MASHAGLVRWREWGEEAFSDAKRLDRLILLDISAVWCHWCHVMDETSYSDPEVAAQINEKFIPVRVDTDRMPDVNERYNMGGWPTTAFLTPTGEVLVGATYVPPDKLRETISTISDFYANNKEDLAERVREFRARKLLEMEEAASAVPEELPGGITRFVLEQIEANYDVQHGGFGTQPKFPVPEAVDLLLATGRETGEARYLAMAEKTMRGMAGYGMYDHVMGGFFRYSVTQDWSVPHFEKMAESNAALIVSFADAYRLTGDDRYLDTVRRTMDYVNEWLWDAGGYFCGSQDADEEYYSLPMERRLKRKSPYVDRTVYANFNAKMADAYLSAWESLDEDCCIGRALSALDFVLEQMSGEGGGLYHFRDDAPHRFGLLTDHAAMLRALLHAFQVTGERKRLEQAMGILGYMDENLWDGEGGGYFDMPYDPAAIGNLAYRSKPLMDNSDAARSLKTLSVITGDDGYADKAAQCLKAHAQDYEEYGYMASGYALAADFLTMPLTEITVVDGGGDGAHALMRAVLSSYVPRRVFRLLRRGLDDAEIKARGYEADGVAAYVCRGRTCSARLTEPAELIREIKGS